MKAKINMRSFGDTIRKERIASRLTQEQLAKEIGCSRGFIRSIESGKRNSLPPMEIIIGLTETLWVSFKDLLPDLYYTETEIMRNKPFELDFFEFTEYDPALPIDNSPLDPALFGLDSPLDTDSPFNVKL